MDRAQTLRLLASKRPTSEKSDRLQFLRADGSSCTCAMPRQGSLAHDLIHYVVESALHFEHGFLGLIAQGADATYVMAQTHDRNPLAASAQAAQAEAIVEALQTQLWAGAFDQQAFLYGVRMAVQARGVAPPDLHGLDLQSLLYDAAITLQQAWVQVPTHASLELLFTPGASRP